MDTTGYKAWTPPVLTKGKYELKVNFVENFQGKNADENGEVSTGMKFRYEVVGPADAVLSSGSSAVGYQFSELLLEPKRSSSQKYIDMCNQKWHAQLSAIFGDDIPTTVEPEDFMDRIFVATCKPKWSDFDQCEMPEISYRTRFGS